MDPADGPDGIREAPGEPSVSPGRGVGETTGGPAPSEAFQTLASEVRVAVLVDLLAAERAGETPREFSELQRAAGSDSSAGFAYHLRRLAGHFVRKGPDGYVLTPAGRRAAQTIVEGTFVDPTPHRAG